MSERDNPAVAKRYKSKAWQKLREEKLKQEGYLCERCRAKGIVKPAYIVHHKTYVTQQNYNDNNIFLNINNLECLCLACHNEEHFKDKEEYIFDEEGNLIANERTNRNRNQISK